MSTTAARPSLVLDDWAPLVAHAVGDLTNERHRHILLRRFGLLDGPNTLQAIADEFAISRERVRQLEGKALTRIRARARRPGTTAHALAAAFDQLSAHDDHTLVSRLVETAGAQFRCQPSWLVKALSRMAGQSPDRTDHLVELAQEYLTYRRQRIRARLHEQQRQTAIDQHLEKWVRDATWPAPPNTATPVAIYRHRMPKTNNHIGHSGAFHSEKLGRTVHFESLLEEAALMTAEKSTHVRSYQEQPCAIPYPSTDSDPGIYIPDLLITLDDGRNLLIEIKPLWQMAVTDNRIKTQAGQRFAHNHGWGWVTIAHAGRTYHDLLLRPINPAAHQALANGLAAGPIDWPSMQQLRQRAPMAALDVAAYAAQNDVALSLTPYRLGP